MNAPLQTIVKGVQQHELDHVWLLAAPLVDKALQYAHGDFDLASVRASLEEGAQPRRQLFVTWPTIEAVMITQIDERPCAKVLMLCAYAGRLSADWRDNLAALEGWAADQGCAAIEIQGRIGWERLLPGYERRAALRKALHG